MTITFFQPPSEPNGPNLSPFCTKMDMMLQLSGLEFERQVQMDPREGPKQKVPFIEMDGQRIGDTQFIEAELKATRGLDMLSDLTAEQQAIGRMIMGTVEEQLYWVMVYSRWQVEENWPIMDNIFFGHMPAEIRKEVSAGALEMMRGALYGHGMGRHSQDEVYTLGRRIIDDLGTLLADKDYFFGDNATSVDASVYGALINLVQNPVPTPLRDYILANASLTAFLDRLSTRFFPNAVQAKAA